MNEENPYRSPESTAAEHRRRPLREPVCRSQATAPGPPASMNAPFSPFFSGGTLYKLPRRACTEFCARDRPEGDSPIFAASCHKNRDSPPTDRCPRRQNRRKLDELAILGDHFRFCGFSRFQRLSGRYSTAKRGTETGTPTVLCDLCPLCGSPDNPACRSHRRLFES